MRISTVKSAPMLAVAVVGLVVGLALPAAARETKLVISGSQIKPNTVTGKQVKESTLTTVPKATLATKLPALVWHPITTFEGSWNNVGNTSFVAGYAVDAQGIVHLRGAITGGEENQIAFTLPAALTPSFLKVPVECATGVGLLKIEQTGDVTVESQEETEDGGNQFTDLDGVTFAS